MYPPSTLPERAPFSDGSNSGQRVPILRLRATLQLREVYRQLRYLRVFGAFSTVHHANSERYAIWRNVPGTNNVAIEIQNLCAVRARLTFQ